VRRRSQQTAGEKCGLDDTVERLRGIGPKLRERLAEVGVTRVADLVLHIPFRYEDRTTVIAVADLANPDERVLVRGKIRNIRVRRVRRRLSIVDAVVEDPSGALPVVWFNMPWVAGRLQEGENYLLWGLIRESRSGDLQLVNPDVAAGDDSESEGVVPVYRRLGPLAGRRLRRLVRAAVDGVGEIEDPLSDDLLTPLGLPPLGAALQALHSPGESLPPPSARRRVAFDELLAFTSAVMRYRVRRLDQRAPKCAVMERTRDLARSMLPFRLTGAQHRVVGEIARDLEREHPMARLLQGDVGSGKTVVAALAALLVLESGHQVAVMAPTELLAEQLHRSLCAFFATTDHEPRLLTASCATPQRRDIGKRLRTGDVKLVVGTHALIQTGVTFRRLGLAVIDEQHRFGVAQRQALLEKGEAPHLLVMTATPIPRSLALTLYGDLELSVMDELPPGRQPVSTVVRPASARQKVFDFIRREVAAGGRAFIVYPLIEASETIEARALEDQLGEVCKALEGVPVGVLHGRLRAEVRDEVAAAFRTGDISVLLATTVVEVGVDVPEATVMVVESAQRFGLSQLHQLRGRVGRGRRRSFCILMTDDEVPDEARSRLQAFCATNDGFEIAEQDLRLRGPGEMDGTRQWGPSRFKAANLVRDRDLVEKAREIAVQCAEDGRLESLRESLARFYPTELELPAG